jgi:nicotinamidase-related amidase
MKKINFIIFLTLLLCGFNLFAQEKKTERMHPALLVIDIQNKFLPEDPKVIKTYGNGFNKTDLEKVLRDKGANTLFLCGLSSVGCVLATWMGAQDLDFKAFLLKDAIMSHNADYTNQIEDIFSAIGYEVVEVMLDNAEK